MAKKKGKKKGAGTRETGRVFQRTRLETSEIKSFFGRRNLNSWPDQLAQKGKLETGSGRPNATGIQAPYVSKLLCSSCQESPIRNRRGTSCTSASAKSASFLGKSLGTAAPSAILLEARRQKTFCIILHNVPLFRSYHCEMDESLGRRHCLAATSSHEIRLKSWI